MKKRQREKPELKDHRPTLYGKPPPKGTFGEILYNYRVLHHLLQDELAKKMGYKSRSMICRWFTGRGQPKWSTIFKIAQKLDVPVSELFPPQKLKAMTQTKAELMVQINRMTPATQKLAQQHNHYLLHEQTEKEARS